MNLLVVPKELNLTVGGLTIQYVNDNMFKIFGTATSGVYFCPFNGVGTGSTSNTYSPTKSINPGTYTITIEQSGYNGRLVDIRMASSISASNFTLVSSGIPFVTNSPTALIVYTADGAIMGTSEDPVFVTISMVAGELPSTNPVVGDMSASDCYARSLSKGILDELDESTSQIVYPSLTTANAYGLRSGYYSATNGKGTSSSDWCRCIGRLPIKKGNYLRIKNTTNVDCIIVAFTGTPNVSSSNNDTFVFGEHIEVGDTKVYQINSSYRYYFNINKPLQGITSFDDLPEMQTLSLARFVQNCHNRFSEVDKKFESLQNALNIYSDPIHLDWAQGTFGTSGTTSSSSTRVRSSFIQAPGNNKCLAVKTNGLKAAWYQYTSNSTSTFTGVKGAFSSKDMVFLPQDNLWYRILLAKEDDSAIVPAQAGATIYIACDHSVAVKQKADLSFLGGLKFQSITQEEYDLMDTHDANTIYFIKG